ncbi:TPA: recombinase family protein [Citrobacter gillenii]
MTDIAYIRVSSIQQDTDRQLANMTFDKTFTEKLSGKDTKRPQLQAMLDYVREGDTVHVHEVSRLGRNTKDLLTIIDTLTTKGVTVWFHKENIKAGAQGDMTGNLMLTILAGVAQMEREMMLTRQAEGYAAKKAKGEPAGRGKSKSIDHEGIASAIAAGGSVRSIAKAFNVSPNTVQRIKKESNE